MAADGCAGQSVAADGCAGQSVAPDGWAGQSVALDGWAAHSASASVGPLVTWVGSGRWSREEVRRNPAARLLKEAALMFTPSAGVGHRACTRKTHTDTLKQS